MTEFALIHNMVDAIDQQIADGSHNKHIMAGFTDEQLRTVRLFIRSFLHRQFLEPGAFKRLEQEEASDDV